MKSRTKSWPGVILKEVISFLEMALPSGVTVKALSAAMQVPESRVSGMFKSDDLRLSMVENLAGNLGYELHLKFPVFSGMEPIEKKEYPCTGNLAGLSRYISDSNRSLSFVAKEACCSYDMLKRALSTGDIKISSLRKVEEALGINCVWEWVRIEE